MEPDAAAESRARDYVRASGQPQDRGPAAKATPTITPARRAAMFMKWDTDHDGKLSFEEYRTGLEKQADAEQRFKNFDRNGNGMLSEEGYVRAGKP